MPFEWDINAKDMTMAASRVPSPIVRHFKRGKIGRKEVYGREAMQEIWDSLEGYHESEAVISSAGTPYPVLLERVHPDADGPWKNKICVVSTRHVTKIGVRDLTQSAKEYLEDKKAKGYQIDILSVVAALDGDKLNLVTIYRDYGERAVDFNDLFLMLGEVSSSSLPEDDEEEESERHFIPPVEDDEDAADAETIRLQGKALKAASEEMPYLNGLHSYARETKNEKEEGRYDLWSREKNTPTIMPYEDFRKVFTRVMKYVTGTEMNTYRSVLSGRTSKENFDGLISAYVQRTFIDTNIMPMEDRSILLKKVEMSLFDLYIIRELIDDPDITDIKITSYDSVRVRIRGRAYISNVTFIDKADYERFIEALSIRTGIDPGLPTQTFTDEENPDYILRFTLTASYIMSTGVPCIHIRKVARKKLMAPELMAAGMMDEKIRDYLLDCGRKSRGVVFAGPPGSGKTIMLNWFLEEAYEAEAEILVIQENDELFANRKGVMFEHVVLNPIAGQRRCSLEELGQIALVAGANVFIIGEAKGAEICSAITLSNSGSRVAMTIHSNEARQTIDKMADLAMRGYAESHDAAMRMIRSFETIVYLKDFKVEEIMQVIGYDEKKRDMVYRPIYRRGAGD